MKKKIVNDNKNNLKHYGKKKRKHLFLVKRKAIDGYINKPSPQEDLNKYNVMLSHSMVMLLICQKTNHKKFQIN